MPGRKEKKEAGQKDKGGVTPPPPAAVSKLKEKLASLKARLSGSEKPAPWDTVGDAGDGQCEVVSSEEEDYQPSPEKLDTGTEIIPFHKEKKKKESKSLNAVATRGTTMKGLQGQLANRALAAMDQHRSKKKEKKSPAEKVGEAIVKALGVGKVKKEKKGKKRKSKKEDKKKRKKSGGDPSSSGDSSDSGESSGGSSMDQDSGSSEEYENLMRKKSRDRPAAILEMLVQHAKDQLEQSSTVSIPQQKSQVDQGVKLLSYFQILLRPQLGPVTGPVRELFLHPKNQ